MGRDLAYLLDRASISDTVMRYFFALDRFDSDAVRATLADPFTLDAGGVLADPVAPKPLDEFIVELVNRNWGFVSTAHINPNHLIEVDGDSAHVTASMFAAHIAGAAADEIFWGYGIYELDLIRAGEDWKITRLVISPVRAEGADPARVYAAAAGRRAAGKGH
jgi:SnoaL-like domain